jgi:hypothetical protein
MPRRTFRRSAALPLLGPTSTFSVASVSRSAARPVVVRADTDQGPARMRRRGR